MILTRKNSDYFRKISIFVTKICIINPFIHKIKKEKTMKKNLILSTLVALMACWLSVGTANAIGFGKKVHICSDGSTLYHTNKKCKELKSCGLPASVKEKDAIKEGKSLCPECQERDAKEEAEKAQKKAEKKAKAKAKKAEKKAKEAKKEAKEQKALKKAQKEAQKAQEELMMQP